MDERKRFVDESKGLGSEAPFEQTEPKAPLTIGRATTLTGEQAVLAYQDAIRGSRAAAQLVVTRGKRIRELENEVQRLRRELAAAQVAAARYADGDV